MHNKEEEKANKWCRKSIDPHGFEKHFINKEIGKNYFCLIIASEYNSGQNLSPFGKK